MKQEIEEPVKKSWKLLAGSILLLILLVATAILLVTWTIANSKGQGNAGNPVRIIVSGVAIILMIVTLCIFIIKMFKPARKGRHYNHSRKHTASRRYSSRSKYGTKRKY